MVFTWTMYKRRALQFGWLTFIIAMGVCQCFSGEIIEVNQRLVSALNMVEAGGRTSNVPTGDNGRAIGPFQIHKAYWQDSGVRGGYSQCTNYDYSLKVVTAYLNRYAPDAVKSNDFEKLARIHNGGPQGHKKQATLGYWAKVKKALDKNTK